LNSERWVTQHNQLFDAKWIRGQRSPEDVILGSADASSLGDLGAAFTVGEADEDRTDR
jgi:hypothetical protein